MTTEEKGDLQRLTRALEDNNLKLACLDRTLIEHMTKEQACAAKVDNLDRVVFRESEPGKPGLKRRQDILDDWKDRADFVGKGILGGALRKAGDLAITAVVLGALLFMQSCLVPAKGTSDKTEHWSETRSQTSK